MESTTDSKYGNGDTLSASNHQSEKTCHVSPGDSRICHNKSDARKCEHDPVISSSYGNNNDDDFDDAFHDNDDNKIDDERGSFLGQLDGKNEVVGSDTKTINCNTVIDRGYSWIIVAAVFLLHFLVIGYLKSGGIFFVEFQRKFKSNASLTSLVIGLSEGFFSIAAPVVMGLMVKVLSVRQICLIGSLVFVMGVIGNALCEDVKYLILTYSIGFGFAKALIVAPSFVIINNYFLKRRALATSIATTGMSCGGIVMPLLARLFFDSYGFIGGILMTGGVTLHAFIGSVLLIPIKHQHSRNGAENTNDSKLYTMNEDGSIIFDTSQEKGLQLVDEKVSNINSELSNNIHKKLDHPISYSAQDPQTKYLGTGTKSCGFEIEEIVTTNAAGSDTPTNCSLLENQIRDLSNGDKIQLQSRKRNSTSSQNSSQNQQLEDFVHSSRNLNGNDYKTKQDTSNNSLYLPTTTNHQIFKGRVGSSLLEPKPFYAKHSLSGSSIFNSTSSLNNTIADITVVENDFCYQTSEDSISKKQNVSTFRKLFPRICGNPVFRSASFWILLPYYLSASVGCGLPQIFLVPLVKERGLTDKQATECLSVLNAMDIIAHIASGLILNTGRMKSTTVAIIPMAVMGFVGHLTPFFHSFEPFMVLSVIIGLCAGFFYTMQSLFVIDTLGIHNFASAMGFYYLTMGIGGATSFPIAGVLRDLTGTYSTSFHYLASMQFLAVVILLVLPFVKRYDVRRGVLER